MREKQQATYLTTEQIGIGEKKKMSRSESKTRLSVSYLFFLSDIRYRIQSSNEKKKRLENMLEAHSPFLRALITFYTQVKLIELTQQGTSVEYFF